MTEAPSLDQVPPSEGSMATRGPSDKRVVAAGMIGTVVEYFDFLVYATVSGLVFGQLFFRTDNEFVAMMLVWSTFAVGFLVRPLGGIVFGHFGDKIGRTKVLFITLTMMGVATVGIGLLPTYETIGVAAPILLVALRIIQGLGVGGEYGGAALLVIEHNHDTGRRGLFGALMSASSALGFLIASGLMAVITALTSDAQFSGWAWRIPFLLSALLLGVGFYIRYRIGETPMMEEAKEKDETVKHPVIELFRSHPRELIIALSAPFGLFAAYYVILVFSIPFAVQNGHSSEAFLLSMSTIAQGIYLCSVVFGGYLSDKFGRRTPLMIGAAGLALWSFAFFPLLLSGSVSGTLAGFIIALLFLGLIYGPMAAYLAEMFGTGVRFTGLSFGYQVSAALAGGLSPLLATYLVHQSGGSWIPVAGMVGVALMVTFVAVFLSHDRTNADLRA